jgi:RNase H-fold protein (predicted Holliday junction resolvase)
MRNDPYTHFLQQLHNNFISPSNLFSTKIKRKQNKTKKIIKYYQPRQLVVGLL